MPLRSADFQQILWPNTFENQKMALRSGIILASPGVRHRPRSDYSLHFDITNIWQIRTEKYRRLLAAAMSERWPQVCRVKITFESLITNWFVSKQQIR